MNIKLNIHFKIVKIALLTGAFFAFFNPCLAQNGILELFPGSDLLGYDSKTGAHRLVGNVSFNYQGNKMYCDSAHYFDKKQEVRAYGHVQINKSDTLNLFCDSLYYNGRTRYAKLWGHVRVRDNEYKLTTDSLDYDAAKGQAIYKNKGKVESIAGPEVLTSKVGYFYPQSKNFFFKGDVVYKSPDLEMHTDTLQYKYFEHKVYFFGDTEILADDKKLYCKEGWYNTASEEGKLIREARIEQESKTIFGDTLYYRPKDSLSIGVGNVRIIDTTEKIEFRANYAYNSDREKLNYITDQALVIKVMDKDTFYIHADTLFQFKDTAGVDQIVGRQHVQFFKNNTQGRCDTIIYNDSLNWVEMIGRPIVWAKNSELKGRFMKVFLTDSSMQKIEILDDAMAISEVDSGKYYNQIFGNRMDAFFTGDDLTRTDVTGNAITLYFPEETNKTDTAVVISRKGLNRLLASDIRIYLDSGEVVGVTYLDQPDGVFLPMEQISREDQYISGFSWKAYARPASYTDLLIDKDPDVRPAISGIPETVDVPENKKRSLQRE